MPPGRDTSFYRSLYDVVEGLGGLFNAHLHLDRAGTLARGFSAAHAPLTHQHARIPELHSSAELERERIAKRAAAFPDGMIAVGTRRADTFTDVTLDNVGLSSLETLLELERARADEIDLRIGAYSPLGFTDAEPERFALLREGARRAGSRITCARTPRGSARWGFGGSCGTPCARRPERGRRALLTASAAPRSRSRRSRAA